MKHGLGGTLEGGAISIGARVAGDRLLLSVEDDGAGFPRGWTEGTGLGNLRQRLIAHYDGQATLDVSNQPSGSRVSIEVPFTCAS